MNRYQQTIGEKKSKIGGVCETKFLNNKEGFYSPIRDYKKFKKMEEFQLPDINKCMLFPLKSERNKISSLGDSEPTAFQNYKKHQQVSFKKIEDRVHSNKNNDFLQLELQAISNSIPILPKDNANETDNFQRYNNDRIELPDKDQLRLSLQNVQPKQNVLQQSQQKLQAAPINDVSHQGYNVIQSHRIRVSSLEKMTSSQQDVQTLKQQQQEDAEQEKNNEAFEKSFDHFIQIQGDNRLNTSLNGLIDLNKSSNKKARRQMLSYHFDSTQNLQKEDTRLFGFSDLYQNLRQSLEQVNKGSQPILLSERGQKKTKTNRMESIENEGVKRAAPPPQKIKKHKNFSSNNLSDGHHTFNFILSAQKQQQSNLEKDTSKTKNNTSCDNVELMIKNKNPYLNEKVKESLPIVQENQQNTKYINNNKASHFKENDIIQTDIIDKRIVQHNLINYPTQEENSPLFGSTRFLNFLPHHIKKKKIQLNLQIKQGQSFQKVEISARKMDSDSNQLELQTSETKTYLNQPNKHTKEFKKISNLLTPFQSEFSNESKQKAFQNTHNSSISISQMIKLSEDDLKIKGQSKGLQQPNLNVSQLKETKYHHQRVQGYEKLMQDIQPHSYREQGGSYYSQPNTKVGKIKLEEQGYDTAKNRLTFTQFQPWENQQKLNSRKQQLNLKQSQTCDVSPKESILKTNGIQNDKQQFNSSVYERKFIEFDINDYFQMKENK